MRTISTVLRVLLGGAFVVFGLNFFLHFLPAPAPMSPRALGFLGGFVDGHFLTLVKALEIGAGLLLLSNRFVPLALTLLAPLLVGILQFHAVFAPAGLPVPVVLLGLEIALAWQYRHAFLPMLRAKTEPAIARDPATPAVGKPYLSAA